MGTVEQDASRAAGTVIHVSPHPDDEVLGAGATLQLLRRHGWRVLNIVCTLGRPADRERRRAELTEAAERAIFEPLVLDPPVPLSRGDDLAAGARAVSAALQAVLERTGASLVVSPHPHDGHHAHEAVGRAVRDTLQGRPGVTWWMWGLWADLPHPTLMTGFDEDVLRAVRHTLGAYSGENARNPYDGLVESRARAAVVLGSERVFGFGAARATPLPFAELLTETRCQGGVWLPGRPRLLDPAGPLPPWPRFGSGPALTGWLHSPSPSQRLREQA